MRLNERYDIAGSGVHVGLHTTHHDVGVRVHGELFIRMVDATTGAVLHDEHRENLITLDAGILVAMLCRSPASRPNGINMLAVGTGATGAILSPNAPDNRQRKLNAEIARKGFSSTVFRDGTGTAVAYPTNVVDFTTTFGEAEAVGPINEMGLLSTISSNPAVRNPNPNTFPTRDTTVDVSTLDILVNYITCAPISKPSTAVLSITWRITF
jgi:hypothetical protein